MNLVCYIMEYLIHFSFIDTFEILHSGSYIIRKKRQECSCVRCNKLFINLGVKSINMQAKGKQ